MGMIRKVDSAWSFRVACRPVVHASLHCSSSAYSLLAEAREVERKGICRNQRGHSEYHCKKYRAKEVCDLYDDGCFWDIPAK